MHPSLFPYHPERDVYRLLQVDSTATSEEISAACRRLARTFHPDRNRSPRANEEMGVINAVRDMLADPRERAAYDRARTRFITGWTPGAVQAARVAVSTPVAPPASGTDAVTPSRGGWRSLPAAVQRTLRALVAAFRAALGQFGPTHCPVCATVVGPEYLFCASCGAQLRRARRLTVSRE